MAPACTAATMSIARPKDKLSIRPASKISRATEIQPYAENDILIEVTCCSLEKFLPPNELDIANKIDAVSTLKFITSFVSPFALLAFWKLKTTAAICFSSAILIN